MNGAERFAGGNFVADLLMNVDADGGIDGIFFAFAASAEDDAGGADLFALDRSHISSPGTGHLDAVIGARKARRIVDRADVASLQLDHLAESLEGFAGGDDLLGELLALRHRLGHAPEKEHPGCQFEAELAQIRRTAAVQYLDALLHFERVAHHAAERLVHVGDERDHLLAHALASFDHEFGEEDGVFLFFHERAGAGLHVEHERVGALRQFLAHDRGADEVRTLDRAGNVAQCVQLAIRRSDLLGLANHGASAGLENAMELGHGETYAKSGNGFEFVERASGVAQSAAANHGDVEAAGSDQRSQHERSLVADAAGGVLVHFFCGQEAEVEDFAGMQHGVREGGGFLARHSAQHDRHQPRGHLVIGNAAVRCSHRPGIRFQRRIMRRHRAFCG